MTGNKLIENSYDLSKQYNLDAITSVAWYSKMREKIGTQQEVAELLGITRVQLSRRENCNNKSIKLEYSLALELLRLQRGIDKL